MMTHIETNRQTEFIELHGYSHTPENKLWPTQTKIFWFVETLDKISLILDLRVMWGDDIWFATSPYKITIDPEWGDVDITRERYGQLWLYGYEPKANQIYRFTTRPANWMWCESHIRTHLRAIGNRRYIPTNERGLAPFIWNYREIHYDYLENGWE